MFFLFYPSILFYTFFTFYTDNTHAVLIFRVDRVERVEFFSRVEHKDRYPRSSRPSLFVFFLQEIDRGMVEEFFKRESLSADDLDALARFAQASKNL